MHMHIDMSNNHQYIPTTTSHEQRPCSSVSPPAVVPYAVQELDPYSATTGVSSFNYPATADSTLLTPVSSAASPPLHHSPSTKNMRTYHASSTAVHGTRGPTPPNTSAIPNHTSGFSDFNMGGSSQSSSPIPVHQRVNMVGTSQSPPPMVVHPVVTEAQFDMNSYHHLAQSPPDGPSNGAHHQRQHHHHSPDRADIPPPIDPYLGHFSVSAGSDAEVTHHMPEYQPYHGVGGEIDPSLGCLIGQSSPGMPVNAQMQHQQQQQQQQQQHMVRGVGVHVPLMTQAPPYRSLPPRVGAIGDMRNSGLYQLSAQPGAAVFVQHVAVSQAGRRTAPRKKAASRRTVRSPKQQHTDGSSSNAQQDERLTAEDGEKEELTVRADCPQEEQFLFELRKEFLSERGKGMWEEIRRKFSEHSKSTWEKAALQMKVSRCVAKYGLWPEAEHERLREAIAYIEERYWAMVLDRMKKLGGCKCWDWRTQHLESEAIKLGLVEPKVDEKTGTRRRRAKHIRRQVNKNASAQFQEHGQPPVHQHQQLPSQHMMSHSNGAIPQEWNNGVDLHSSYDPLRHASYDATPMGGHMVGGGGNGNGNGVVNVNDGPVSASPTFTSEQEDEFLDEVFQSGLKAEPEDADSDVDMQDYNSKQQQQQQRRLGEGDGGGAARESNGSNNYYNNDNGGGHSLNTQGSERVARQACEQLMQRVPMRRD